MKYLFDAKTVSFYPLTMKDGYEASGTWPDSGIEVDEDVFCIYTGQPPQGKQRGADNEGNPAWVDIPPPPPLTQEQQIAKVERQKAEWLEKAGKAIAPLQDADDLGIATAKEKADLVAWKKFRVAINRIDTSDAPDIAWPEKPE